MKNWLVTGGAGFIGSHLVRKLIGYGDHVHVLDDLSSGSANNLNECENTSLIVGNIQDATLCRSLAQKCDGIYHLAARVSVQECIDNWVEGHADNVVGTINIFSAAAQVGIPVVYASSAAVYGNQSGKECIEHMLGAPISPYGADKLSCEHQAASFYHVNSLASIGLRFFNVYGPRQDPRSPYAGVISKFAACLQNNEQQTIFGDGLQSRDFVYIDDVVKGLTKSMEFLLKNGSICDVSNICTGIPVNLLETIHILSEVNGTTAFEPKFRPTRTGDIRHSRGSTKHMQALLGIGPMTDIKVGLTNYLVSLK